MSNYIDIKKGQHLKEIAYEMSLLLVEDDDVLLKQLHRYLSRFFKKVDTATNGIEALELYTKSPYDLVITDLTMPLMNGIELSNKIRCINEKQNIFVLSAHSESEKLIALINIGIDGFLLKPLDMNVVILQLIKICQAIYDHKILEYFNDLLEESNRELKRSNTELAKTLNQLNELKSNAAIANVVQEQSIFVAQTGRELNEDEQIMLYTRSDKISAIEFHTAYPFELDKTNEDLELLEDNFNFTLMKASKNINDETLNDLIKILRNFAKVIELIPQFGALSFGIQQLARTFESNQDPEKLKAIMPMLTSLFENLEQWRRGIFFYRNVEDIHYMDNSLISDALSLQGILDNDHATSSADIELF